LKLLKPNCAEAKLKALSEAEALAKQRASTAPASANADATKKSIEAEAEKKKAEEEKKKAEEARAAAAQSDPRRLDQQAPPKTQENTETLLAELNTKMGTLLKYTWTVANNTNETVNATRGLTKDLFKSL